MTLPNSKVVLIYYPHFRLFQNIYNAMVCRVDEGAFFTSSFSVIHVLVCLQLWLI